MTIRTLAIRCLVTLTFGAAFHAAQAQLAPPPKLLPQTTLRPAPTPMAAPATAATPTVPPRWCEEDCLVGPTKPLRFDLLAGERESSGFHRQTLHPERRVAGQHTVADREQTIHAR